VHSIYTTPEISSIIGGELSCNSAATTISQLAFDSRSISLPALSLFFCIRSAKNDGHKYIAECYGKGVRNFVVEQVDLSGLLPPSILGDINLLKVDDSVIALQALSAWHRQQFDLEVIGITGSNGKTVLKEWLYQLLYKDHSIVRSPRSYNSQIGVPLSVWQIEEGNDLGIFEAGISRPGEMAALESIIKPSIGVFTNLGEAHQAFFGSLVQKAEEKLRLFRNVDTLVYCKDQQIVQGAISKTSLKKGVNLLAWSACDAEAEIFMRLEGTKLIYKLKEESGAITLPFTDKASVENISHCIVLLWHLGYSTIEIEKRLKKLESVEMRLELKEGINGCTLINDSYNSDLGSLTIALDLLNQQNQHPKKTLVLSDILESGKSGKILYRETANLLQSKNIDRLIGIGQEISANKGVFEGESLFFPDTDAFLRDIDLNSFRNEAILIKGSRSFGFEKIARRLQQKSHITELHINLNSLVHNLGVYKSMLAPATKVMAMVKAFSYGSGSFEIANVLQHNKIDYLGVAYADEGIYLRQHGIEVPIMVMNPEANAFEAMLQYNLEPEIYSFTLLNALINTLRNSTEGPRPFPIHIKVDTGMHRLGFMRDDIEGLADILRSEPNISVRSVFSHLASTDIPGHDDFTKRQISIFEEACSEIRKAGKEPFLKHILNTTGISRFPEAQYDMVRLGLGLYGLDSDPNTGRKLEPVSSLITHISQVKQLAPGEAVGYARKSISDKPRTIATIGIGYADGFPRSLGNEVGSVIVNGHKVPVVGNVCMDMSMIDITGIEAAEGDEVIIFGKGNSIEDLAKSMGTIPYEVLTNVSQRVKRVYFRE
jgi:alanine racemase